MNRHCAIQLTCADDQTLPHHSRSAFQAERAKQFVNRHCAIQLTCADDQTLPNHSRSAFQAERAKQFVNRRCAIQLTSENDQTPPDHSRSAFQAEGAKQFVNRRCAIQLTCANDRTLPNHSRSAFQAEGAKQFVNRRCAIQLTCADDQTLPHRRTSVGRSFLTCLRATSLARFGKPSNYSRSAFQAEGAKQFVNRRCAIQLTCANDQTPHHRRTSVGLSFLTCLRMTSLARFGKPSNYSRSAFQAEGAKRSIHSRKLFGQCWMREFPRRQTAYVSNLTPLTFCAQ